MRIVLCYPVEKRHINQIQAAAPQAEVVDAGQEHVAREIFSADVFCGHAKVPMPWDEVVCGGRLKWIQSSAAGLDHCLVPSVVASNITVTSASGVLADQVAEQSIALATGLSRSLPVYFRAQQAHEFVRRPTRDLMDSTVGIVGLGGNGRRLAEVLSVFNARILATDKFPVDKPACVAELWPAERLDDLLREVEFLFLCAPLTDETRGMIDRRALSLMRPDGFLINVARGPLVVESDLIEALEAGRLAGAGVDVTEVEPLATTSRLWDLPNVIITPHVGGQSRYRIDQMTAFFCENLRRYQRDEPLVNLVDNRLCYPARVATTT